MIIILPNTVKMLIRPLWSQPVLSTVADGWTDSPVTLSPTLMSLHPSESSRSIT